MDLRELKKEAQSLPSISEQLRKFQLSWVKPLRAKTSLVLAHLDKTTQQELKRKLSGMNPLFSALRGSHFLQEKLQQQSRSLVELKLNALQGNQPRCQQLIQLLIKDPVFNIKQTLLEVQQLERHLSQLAREYSALNASLEEQLSLEGALLYSDLPHQQHLLNLHQTAQQQKNLARKIAEQFVALTREIKVKHAREIKGKHLK